MEPNDPELLDFCQTICPGEIPFRKYKVYARPCLTGRTVAVTTDYNRFKKYHTLKL